MQVPPLASILLMDSAHACVSDGYCFLVGTCMVDGVFCFFVAMPMREDQPLPMALTREGIWRCACVRDREAGLPCCTRGVLQG